MKWKYVWILSIFVTQAFSANFNNDHVGNAPASPYSIVAIQNKNLWVTSLVDPKNGGMHSNGAYPSNASGNLMPLQNTLAYSENLYGDDQQKGIIQYISFSNASDYYDLNYNVFVDVTGYDSNGAATGPFVDMITFTITPMMTTATTSKGGTVTIGAIQGNVLPFTYTPQASKVPPATIYPNFHFPSGTIYRGINMPGGEFPNFFDMPPYTNGIYYAYKGINLIRLPFSWENIQPDLGVPIDFSTGNAHTLAQFVQNLTAAVPNMYIILDMHNYMRYNGNIIGAMGSPVTALQYANAWASFATEFKTNSKVFFDLMNEPHDMPTELILSNYNAAIAMIRNNGFNNYVLLEGNGYSCLGTWTSSVNGETPNMDVFIPAKIVDPQNNYVINAHEYFDGANNTSCGSGESSTCVNAQNVTGIENFSLFTDYLKKYSLKAILTELNAAPNTNCVACIQNFLTAIEENSLAVHGTWGFIGWSAWASLNITPSDVLSLVPNTTGTGVGMDRLQWTSAYDNFLLPPSWTP